MSHELKSLRSIHQFRHMQRDKVVLEKQRVQNLLDSVEDRLTQLQAQLGGAESWLDGSGRTYFDAAELLMIQRYTAQLQRDRLLAECEMQKLEAQLANVNANLVQAQLAIDQTEYRTRAVLRQRIDDQRAIDCNDADLSAVLKFATRWKASDES